MCASFYERDGYRFDVGATLVGGFGARGVHRKLNARLGIEVSHVAVEPSMIVHLPDDVITRFGDVRWKTERLRAFGPQAETFWQRQQQIAERAWDLSTRNPAVPQDFGSIVDLASAIRPRHVPLAATLGRSVASIMPRDASQRLRTFVDAQLLITAQTDARHADLAYGSTALDLAREGTFSFSRRHFGNFRRTGAARSVAAVRRSHTCAASGRSKRRAAACVRSCSKTARASGCDVAIAAIPVQNLVALAPALGSRFRARVASLPQRYGAFVTYCGLPAGLVPDDLATQSSSRAHVSRAARRRKQRLPLVLGTRRRTSRRVTAAGRSRCRRTSTSRVSSAPYADGTLRETVASYERTLLDALDRVVPGASARALVIESATPHTFARYTGTFARPRGRSAADTAKRNLRRLRTSHADRRFISRGRHRFSGPKHRRRIARRVQPPRGRRCANSSASALFVVERGAKLHSVRYVTFVGAFGDFLAFVECGKCEIDPPPVRRRSLRLRSER